jgi:competence protein ComEC
MKSSKIKLIIVGVLATANILVWLAYFSFASKDKLEVVFFDVGQGDAAFIETPGGRKILIDGGPDNSILAKIGRKLPFFDRDIDIMIITHPDSDHLAGAVEVAKNYDIGLILTNGKDCATKICAEFEKVIKEKNIKIIIANAGQKIDFGQGIKMDIFLPARGRAGEGKNENNDFSVISRLAYGADSFLFMGDAEEKEEMELLNYWPNSTAEVLKVGHHGSKSSTSQLFLDKIKPKFSIISAGAKNRYGHPRPETLEKLEKIGAAIFRTDLEGDIRMESAGSGVAVK